MYALKIHTHLWDSAWLTFPTLMSMTWEAPDISETIPNLFFLKMGYKICPMSFLLKNWE